MGGGSEPLDTKHGQYLGGWGNLDMTIMVTPALAGSVFMACQRADGVGIQGSQTQKGITTYAISANRQRPLAGTANAAVFNTWRRFRAQALYFIPPFAVAYWAMNWAIEKNEYLNSKPGRIQDAEESAEARQGGPVRG